MNFNDPGLAAIVLLSGVVLAILIVNRDLIFKKK